MSTATVDLDELQAEADSRLAELREQRQRLAPEALRTKTGATKLARVEAEIREAEQSLDRVQLARTETARREEQARADAVSERRTAALQRARELQTERQKAAKAVDTALRRFATTLASWDRITTEQEQTLRAAGWNGERAMQARARPWMVEAAIALALRDAGCPRGIVGLQSFTGPISLGPRHEGPLADQDARPVEPV